MQVWIFSHLLGCHFILAKSPNWLSLINSYYRDFVHLRFGLGLHELWDQPMMWQEGNFSPVISLIWHSVSIPLTGRSEITRSKIIWLIAQKQTPLNLVSLGLWQSSRLYPRVCSEVRHRSTQLGNNSIVNVNTSHLFLLLLNLKAGKNTVDIARSTDLQNSSDTRLNSLQSRHIIPFYLIPLPLSVCFALWLRRYIIFHFNNMISQHDCQQLETRFSLLKDLFLLQWRE